MRLSKWGQQVLVRAAVAHRSASPELCRGSRSRRIVFLIFCVSLLTLAMLFIPPVLYGTGSDYLRVAFINVGQGDSAWLHASDQTDILIDGGLPGAGPTVVAYLQNHSIDDIDVLVISHNDADHMGGLIDVLNSPISVAAVIYNGYPVSTTTYLNLVAAMQARGLTPTPALVGQSYTWGPISSTVLNPQVAPFGVQNKDAVVLRLTYGNTHLLFPGDIDSTLEQTILSSGTPITADVLKVAHHGSKYSSSAAFLAAVNPEIAVISVGPNSYGHPAPETLARLSAAGASTFRTDQWGTVVITSDGSILTMNLYRVFLPLVAEQTGAVLNADLHITALSGTTAPEYVTIQNTGAAART